MRTIAKGLEPESLTAHRKAPHDTGTYDNYRRKHHLRQALVSEQRALCCYCMGRIRPDAESMKIEHWRCQKRYRDQELDYRNLLAACRGGHGKPSRDQHCDTRKGDADLEWNPAAPAHHVETRIGYGLDGTICSHEENFDTQINEVLNLNLSVLKAHRKGVLDAILRWWRHEKARVRGRVPHERFLRQRAMHVGDSGELTPYCQVAVWWIDQKLARMRA